MAFPATLLRAALAAALAGLLAGCASGLADFVPRQTILAAERVDLPTTRRGQCLYIDARINGVGPFRLIVDTGASGLMLASDVAAKAGLISSRQGILGTATGFVKSGWAGVARLESGGLTLVGITTGVIDAAELEADRLGGPVDGAVGLRALKDVVLELDFAGKQVSAVRPGTRSYPPALAVDFSTDGFGLPYVVVEVGGKSIRMLVDTGKEGVMDIPDLDAVPLRHPKTKEDGFGAWGVGGVFVRGEEAQLAGDARLGPAIWRLAPLKKVDGSLGAGALEQCKVVFDQRTPRMFLLGENMVMRWGPRPAPDPRFKLGTFFHVQGEGLSIVEVDPGCAGDRAGLRVGDVIKLIDGKDAVEWWFAHGRDVLYANRGFRLRAERAGGEFETRVVLSPDTETPRL